MFKTVDNFVDVYESYGIVIKVCFSKQLFCLRSSTEHIPLFMTYTTFNKNIFKNKLAQKAYKAAVVFYSLYFVFSSQAFALQAEAPVGGQSFKNLVVTETTDTRVDQIRRYYERYDLPLADNAEDFVYYADLYDLDWTLVAAIGFIESTGGKFACKTATYSAFGWGSCKINFDSYEESIAVITKNLSGGNPNTARYYAGKDIRGILWSYNPDTIRKGYGDMVTKQMGIIKSM